MPQAESRDDTQQTQDVLTRLEAQGIKTTLLQFTDISGHIKGVSIPLTRLAETLDRGHWVDGSSLDGFVRMHETDTVLRPDLSTCALLPFTEESGVLARIMCDVYTVSGQPFVGDSRHVLRRALAVAAQLGYTYAVAPEIEFFICERRDDGSFVPLDGSESGYFDLDVDQGAQLRHAIVAAVEAMGSAVEGSHHEVAVGQHEIDLASGDALHIADTIVTLKYIARRLAREQNLHITFMPKPFNALSGSGMHIHQMLIATAPHAAAATGPYAGSHTLTALASGFIAGQLEHAPAFTAITNPLVNSYKRLVSGYEAPSAVMWGRENRSALIRVPRIPTVPTTSMEPVELRICDPACNPYLALAAMLRAGLAGVEQGLPAPDPSEDRVRPFEDSERLSLEMRLLPFSLGEALTAFSASNLMRDVFGEYVFGRFVEIKRREWHTAQTRVTDWERTTYWETA